MKHTILALTVLSHLTANAAADYCQAKPLEDVKKVKVDAKASYFFRVFPNSDKVSFASDNVNYIMDLNTKKVVKLPGIYDPVPMGDFVVSVPSKKNGMTYYSIPEILSGNSQPKPLYQSADMGGVYQSTGLVERGEGYNIFGIIAAGINNIQYQKLKVTYTPMPKVEPVSEVISLCEGIDIKMPMLSKTSQELSGFDVSAGVSKVWSINPDTKTCVEVDNLKMFAAKADFSYDSKKLTFHISANGFTYKMKTDSSGEVDWVERPSSEMSQSVYEYDRVKRTITRISTNYQGSNAYYPVYQKDGSILYAFSEPNGDFSFELIRPKQIAALSTLDNSYKLLSAAMIGRLWSLTCASRSGIKSQKQLVSIALGLKKDECLNLVDEHWSLYSRLRLVNFGDPVDGSKLIRGLMGRIDKQNLIGICQELR